LATTEGMTALDPAHLSVLRIRAAIMAALLVAAVGALEMIGVAGTPLPVGAATLAAFSVAAAAALLMPRRRYRSWSYRMDEDELHISSGVWTRTRTVVPFGRVQHIDVVQGPLQRRFGVASLVLHTAGTRSAAVLLPGLAADDAARMRDHIRGRIREDLM